MKKQIEHQLGFTLLELMVVITIIGLMSSIIFTSLAATRIKGRDTKRKGDMNQLQKALELYYNTNYSYPDTSGAWWAITGGCGGAHTLTGATGYIPNLAPTYLGQLPVDPKPSTDTCSGYNYRSDGNNYKLIDNAVNGAGGPESFPTSNETFYDPARPTTAWMITNNTTATVGW